MPWSPDSHAYPCNGDGWFHVGDARKQIDSGVGYVPCLFHTNTLQEPSKHAEPDESTCHASGQHDDCLLIHVHRESPECHLSEGAGQHVSAGASKGGRMRPSV
eukprot:4659116-Karenia_brevis.AAC.1